MFPGLIVTDLDGTALRDDKTVSEATCEAFAKCRQKGIPVALATARYLVGAAPYAKALSADFQILTDGTLVFHKGKLIYANTLDIQTTNHILTMLKECGATRHIAIPTAQGLFRHPGNIDINHPFPFPASKFVVELANEEDALRIAASCDCHQFHYRGENRYTFYHKTAGKLDAIRHVAGYLGIPMKDVLVFGDDVNDLEMIQNCGTGIAMENALPEVKAAADAVTASNEEDGVAQYLSQILN